MARTKIPCRILPPRCRLLGTAALVMASSLANAAVSPDEAAKLGTTLTPIGAQKAGNADGSIPPYTGGLPQDFAPPGYTSGDTMLPDPFASEKPILVISGQNMEQHKDKLTAVTQELLRRYPTYRVDVYPSHRTAPLAPHQIENARLNATGARTIEGGLAMENVLPGVPFPIPATGNEAMWNHLFGVPGELDVEFNTRYESWNVTSDGTAVLATSGEVWGARHWPPRKKSTRQSDPRMSMGGSRSSTTHLRAEPARRSWHRTR